MTGIARRFAAALGVTAALLLVACGGGGGSGGGSGSTPTSAAARTTAPETTPTPAATVAPTSAAITPGASFGNVSDEPVAFQTEDGVTVRGHLYAASGPKRKVVIFAHEYPKDQKAWQPFARELASQGINALTFDFRGYGETGGSKDVSKIDRDLTAAVRFIKSRDYLQVYVVGASMGGTAAIKVAAKEAVAGVVTVSAPTDFMGLDCRPDVPNVRPPMLFIAAKGDDGAPDAVDYFMKNASTTAARRSLVLDGSAHGSDLLSGATAQAVKQNILDFLNG